MTNEQIVLEECSKIAGWDVDLDTPLKTLGYIDSFSNMELLSSLSKTTKQKINWRFDFSKLDTPRSFLEALGAEREMWINEFLELWRDQ